MEGRGGRRRGRGDQRGGRGGSADGGRGRGGGGSQGARGGDGDRGGQFRGFRGGGGGGGRGRGGAQLGADEFTNPNVKIYSPEGEDATPSKEVRAKEDAVVESSKELSLSSLSLGESRLPIRPGYGTEGRIIYLRTNYFNMAIDTSRKLFRYAVDIKAEAFQRDKDGKPSDPKKYKKDESKPGRKQRQAYSILFEDPAFQAIKPGFATDYDKNIITSRELKLDPNGVKSFRFMYRDPEDRIPSPYASRYTFTLTPAGIVPTTELLRYLASTPSNPSDFTGKNDAVQALNIIVARTPNFDPEIYKSGQNKFYRYPSSTASYIDLGEGLIAVRGYYSSVRTSTSRILLNLNAQVSPFYPAGPLLDLFDRFGLGDWLALESFLNLLRVKTSYIKNSDGTPAIRVKTIIGFSHAYELDERGEVKMTKIKEGKDKGKEKPVRGNAKGDHGTAQQISFDCKELGGNVTLEKYFKEKYDLKLQKPHAWVLNCGTRDNPNWIPPELCTVVPGQAYRGKLSGQQTEKMIRVAARPPAENARRIVGAGQKVIGIQASGNPTLSSFGLRVDSKMTIVEARILPPPVLTYGKDANQTAEGGAWNMRGKTFAKPQRVTAWSFLKLGNVQITPDQIKGFQLQLKNYGLGNEAPKVPQGFAKPLPGGENPNDLAVKDIFKVISGANLNIILVVLPFKDPIIYARVKYWGDTEAGVHTVCVLAEKLDKGANYWANVALKFNLKMGGVNQIIPKKLGILDAGDTMLVGIDVTHPAPKSMLKTPSIAGVVASCDTTYGQYPGSIRCQESRKEMVDDLDSMMEERLRLWMKKNGGKCPKNLLVYRDGVSEGEYQKVLEVELPQIREACKKVYGTQPLPKIEIIVVGKRHHTRFYPTNENDADMNNQGNPKNGTCVDRGVTGERIHDFFLQAHAALQGTAKPARYVVIHDELKLGADELQGITHHLCYLFGRATRAVSICPPAYYADILCERGRCYLAKYINTRWPPGKEFNDDEAPWLRGCHPKLAESMWYV